MVEDCQTLLQVRDILSGDRNLNWSKAARMGVWEGVEVGGHPRRVVALHLQNYGLTGVVPTQLSELAGLRIVDLRHNRLTGVIPPELGVLTNLRFLRLHDNRLSGSIPPELAELNNLLALDLGHNQLDGEIPPELGNLQNLELLVFAANSLTGAIPPQLGGIVALQTLELGYNNLAGTIPSELGDLENLRALRIQANMLSGSIPPELGALHSLEALDLSQNQLDGEIPSELEGLQDLRDLYLNHNSLVGIIPAELGSLESLKALRLQVNRLSGSIPPELAELNNLLALHLAHNQLDGGIPPELGNLQNLEFLAFASNSLTGAIPPQLGGIAALQTLELGYNNLAGTIPSELGDLENLRALRIQANMLSGSIPPELGALHSLEALDLSQNQLSGEVPPELGGLQDLRDLYLDHNKLVGIIPAELGSLESLKVLRLQVNRLSGSIPPELSGLNNLLALDLGHNQLDGEVPHELENLRKLQVLIVGTNSLTGVIPPNLGELVALQTLELGYNSLAGTIPSELGDLENLRILRIQANMLSGSIPTELGALQSLEALDLSQNQLSGEIPSELGGLQDLRGLYLNHNSLVGIIPDELGSLEGLEALRLQVNLLVGSIPPQLGRLKSLETLDLGHNRLSGEIPRELVGLPNLRVLEVGNNNWLSGCVPSELREIDPNVGALRFCGDPLPVRVDRPLFDGGVDLGVTYVERLPRFRRYELAYFSSGDCPYPFEQFRGATVCPHQAGIKRWPDPGEPIELIAHVWNFGDTASGPFEYVWKMDGVSVATGVHGGMESGEHAEFLLAAEWPGDTANPAVTFSVDTADEIDELIEDNNGVVDWIKGYTLGFFFSPTAYESLRLSNEPGRLIQSPEQWVHNNIVRLNEILAEAGLEDRVRAELFDITEELFLQLGHDLRWYMDGWWAIWDHSNSLFRLDNYDTRPEIEYALLHELLHQLGAIDLYQMHIGTDIIQLPDANRPDQLAGCGTDYWLYADACFRFPEHIEDIMADATQVFIGAHSAGGLRTNTGHRRGFYGDYLYDTPAETVVRVVNPNGENQPNVTLRFFQKEVKESGEVVDAIPEFELTTDESGRAVLPNRGITGIVTETGHQLRPNPFGPIDVVGRNGIFVIEMEGECTNYEWLTVVELNLAYWDGHTDQAEFQKTLRCLQPVEERVVVVEP